MSASPWLASVLACVLISGCAALAGRDPLQVTVAGIEPLQGQGLEMRMNVKLRVQNPNDTPLDYNGIALQMDVQGKTFASGVSDATGTVPRFGEAVIAVPMTISALGMVHQAMGMMKGAGIDKIEYAMKGKLNGVNSGATRFTSKGQFDFPAPPSQAVD
jgi:LEA14-like dessication related protein